MFEQTQLTPILRKREVIKLFGFSNSTFYDRINKGEMTPGISLGGRAVGWPENELDTIQKAMIAGYSQDQLKELVSQLIEQRTNPIN